MINFVKGFYRRKGLLVSVALLTDKVVQLLAPYIIVAYLSQKVYGDFIYSITIIGLIIPFSGGGLNHSLLFYGNSCESKRSLFSNILISGSFLNIAIILIVASLSPFLTYNRPDSLAYLNYLLIFLFLQFFHLILNNQYRINDLNTKYSTNNLIKSFIFITIVITLVPVYGVYGLILAYILSPIRSFFKSLQLLRFKDINFRSNFKYLKYGLNVGIASIVSQVIILSDNLIIGNFIKNSSEIAIYKIATIIPLGLFFIPNVFLTTDFVEISRMKNHKKKVEKYYLEYLKLFCLIGLLLIPLLYFFSEDIIIKLFGIEYSESVKMFKILLIGTIAVFLLRNPLGFILNAVGQAKINVRISYIMLIVNLIASISLTIKFQLIGAAIATTITLFFGGFISLFFFIKWLKEN